MNAGNKIAVAIVAGFVILGTSIVVISGRAPAVLQQIGAPDGQPSGFAAGVCPTTGQTTGTIVFRNGEDDTADTPFNVTAYLFGDKGHFTTVSATDGGTTVTLNCGETYTLKAVSASGNRGDNANIYAIEEGAGAYLSGGIVTFTPQAATYYIKVVGSMHGVPEFRIYNLDNAGWRYTEYTATSGNVNTWQLTGKAFNGTTSENATVDVGSGGSFTDEIHFRSNETLTDVSDFGYYILVDASTAVWNEPTVRLDGVVLSKAALVSDEARQFSSTYEYAYKVDGKITDAEHVLKVEFKALSGINPAEANSPTIAIAPIGAFKATASNAVKIGAAKDDSSASVVFTTQTATLNIA